MSGRLALTGLIAGAIAISGAACSQSDSGGGGGTAGASGGAAGTHGGGAGISGAAAGSNGGTGTGTGNVSGTGAGGGSPTGAAGGSPTGAAGASATGTAGASAAAGVSGSAGASGTANCISGATMPPVAALITDFSDAVPDPANVGQFKFGGGVATEVQGGTSEFADVTETAPTLAITGGALSVMGSSKGSYAGVVLYMNGPACIDGSAYTGIQFDLAGSIGTCNLTFGFGFADDLTAESDPQRGICAATNCYGPSVAVTTIGTIKEPYTAVKGGSPDMGVDRQKLTGVQWQIQAPATGTTCSANFTIDNVKFY